jgi:chromosome segregation ATPase
MLLAAGLLIEFAEFLQIISWIVLPVLFIAIGLTIFVHYRSRKKKKQSTGSPVADTLLPSLESSPYPASGAYVLFDHSGLIRQYKNKLSYNHARYAALKQDFDKLELKYSAIINNTGDANKRSNKFNHPKKSEMENMNGQLQETIQKMNEEFATEKKELISRLEQLDRSYKSLEAENESLLEQINMQSATGDEKEIIVNRWKEENALLKAELQEKAYLKDLVDEKKAQIEFLQNQVDHRLRSFHQAEQQREEMKAELEKAKQAQRYVNSHTDAMKTELAQKQENIERLINIIEEKDSELTEQQQVMLSKQDRITYLESVLQEFKQQNEILHASVADGHDRAGVLNQQLEDERSRIALVEQRLSVNKQILQRVYKELAACMEEHNEASVVSLRPAYISMGEATEL